MKHKNISIRSSELLTYFNRQNKTCFNFREAFAALPDSKEGTILELLSDMTKRGLLMRLKEGVYYIIPYEQELHVVEVAVEDGVQTVRIKVARSAQVSPSSNQSARDGSNYG